jgi:hypothetical protein
LRLWEHFDMGAPAPPEFIRYLCYHEFGWTYQETRDTPLEEILSALTCLTEEGRFHSRPKAKRVNAA